MNLVMLFQAQSVVLFLPVTKHTERVSHII